MLKFTSIAGEYAVCHLPLTETPTLQSDHFYCAFRSDDEWTIVALESEVEAIEKKEGGWGLLKLLGPFEFTETGILAGVTRVLAEAKIGIFALSSFETDYILVKQVDMEQSIQSLKNAGYRYVDVQ